MDYEKKYKEALTKAESYYRNGQGSTRALIYNIFPELKKSEDERTRKVIADIVKAQPSDSLFNGTKEKCLAWLEKQGEQKLVIPKFRVGDIIQNKYSYDKRVVTIINKDSYVTDDIGFIGFYEQDDWEVIEQKPVELEKEEKSRLMKKCVHRAYQQGYDTGFLMATTELEHKQEWSEEDKKKLEECRSIIKQWQDKQDNYYFEGKFDYAAWLKSLKDRCLPQQQEWSEEDKEMLSACIRIFERIGDGDLIKGNKDDANKYIFFLKSLHPQNR